MLTAYYAWSLKKRDELRSEKIIERAEKIALYTDIYALFETGMHEVLGNKQFTLHSEFSKMNAKVELLAPKNISDSYFSCCGKFEEWSKHHVKSLPPKQEFNGMAITTFQSPDPREKYRKLAEESYNLLLSEIEALKNELRLHLETDN